MSETSTRQYPPGEHPNLPPPISVAGPLHWVRTNLFSSPLNIVLTLLGAVIIWFAVTGVIQWAFINAIWNSGGLEGSAACRNETGGPVTEGACWYYIKVWFKFLMYGRYPAEELWRINISGVIGAVGLAWLVWPGLPKKGVVAVFMLTVWPVFCFYVFTGGAFGLTHVETPLWGGLFLTLVIAIVGIAASLPIGIVFALGRRSKMPVVQIISIIFIEFWRGVPLITVLFMSSVMFPLFMPEGVNFDKLVRALVGVMLFSAAYMAEVVRGGLQAIPKGQFEGAAALGLSYGKIMTFIIMPQALKLVIPGIVNTFIGLFKDTTLVLIIGLIDFLGSAQSSFSNTEWGGFHITAYVFVALIFWVFCFGMSRYSMHVENKLHTGHRR
ncbi:MAG: amino acid ABC transporter permease [Rhodospirillales bacterium]